MKENDRMVQGDSSGFELLQSIVDGKTPMPPMAQAIPMTIISVASGSVVSDGLGRFSAIRDVGIKHFF